MSEMDEKRSFVRLLLELPVKVCQESSQQETIATCIDLSATGMSLKVNHDQYIAGEKLSIEMVPEDEHLPSFNATARVIRVFAWQDAYKLAIEFESIN